MKTKINISLCASFILLFSSCIYSQEESFCYEEQVLLELAQEFHETFNGNSLELLQKSNLHESIHSFLEAYHEIYSGLLQDPANDTLKSQVILFNTNLGELERNLSVLLKSSGNVEIDSAILENILNSLQNLQAQVDASGSVPKSSKIDFVKSMKIIGLTVVAFAAIMVAWKVLKLFKPSKEESQFTGALERVEQGMTHVVKTAEETLTVAQQAQANTGEGLRVTQQTADVVNNLGTIVSEQEGRIGDLEEKTDNVQDRLKYAGGVLAGKTPLPSPRRPTSLEIPTTAFGEIEIPAPEKKRTFWQRCSCITLPQVQEDRLE